MRYRLLIFFCCISFIAKNQNKTSEQQFDSYLKVQNLNDWMKKLSAKPHHLGSNAGRENAEFIRDQFKSWGYDVQIETYKVLFPTPKVRLLELVGPVRYTATLEEPALKEDATSPKTSEQLPVYNAWSGEGDVTAELVFVNYGVPADYEYLERLGIDVKGKIVIAKYGGSWRGIKPKVALEHGAIGCIIYSDPHEDGYFQGDVYPKGPFRNQNGAQRGAVLDMPIYPGDPLTPNVGATGDVQRLDREAAATILKIPVIPISYKDAEPLLRALGGPVPPDAWRGALPFTYHVGPGPAKVHLKLSFDWKLVDCNDVIAKIKGSDFPDEWVIRGNHHDAWVNGANDPISGMVALMEEARAMSELMKTGWKPRRTIVFCAWDGEEPGLIGSTEWAEHHAKELQDKAVAYINSDSNGRGFLAAGGSHTLEKLVNDAAKDVIDPETNVSILERLKSYQASNASSSKEKKDILARTSSPLEALGSGSDFTPFLQHLGVPSLALGFGGEDGGGEYHSVYDSYDMYTRFKDPKFEYGIVLAKTAGRITMRLADAEVLPFDFQSFYKTVNTYATEVMTLLDNSRETTEVENQLIDEKRYTIAADPTQKYIPPVKKDAVPFLNFSSLQNALSSLEKASTKYAEMKEHKANMNKLLYTAEQKLLIDTGLPNRPWFKHSIYAPGFYTGYGVKTLPGIREAIEQRDWKQAQEFIEKTAAAINAYTEQIQKIVSSL